MSALNCASLCGNRQIKSESSVYPVQSGNGIIKLVNRATWRRRGNESTCVLLHYCISHSENMILVTSPSHNSNNIVFATFHTARAACFWNWIPRHGKLWPLGWWSHLVLCTNFPCLTAVCWTDSLTLVSHLFLFSHATSSDANDPETPKTIERPTRSWGFVFTCQMVPDVTLKDFPTPGISSMVICVYCWGRWDWHHGAWSISGRKNWMTLVRFQGKWGDALPWWVPHRMGTPEMMRRTGRDGVQTPGSNLIKLLPPVVYGARSTQIPYAVRNRRLGSEPKRMWAAFREQRYDGLCSQQLNQQQMTRKVVSRVLSAYANSEIII